MFSGSSCTQTTSSQLRVARRARRAGRASGTGRAARRGRSATSAPRRALLAARSDRRRPCRCTGPRARTSRRAPRASSSSMHRAGSGLRRARAASTRPAGGAAGSSASARRAAADRSSSSAACRRSRWKYCAAVVQLATRRLMSAASLQEPLGPRARVLRPLAFVAVRQQQHQRRRQPPLARAPT